MAWTLAGLAAGACRIGLRGLACLGPDRPELGGGGGSDNASCLAIDPCLTLAKAASVTATGGTIFVIDRAITALSP
jgi:hypothetical protein